MPPWPSSSSISRRRCTWSSPPARIQRLSLARLRARAELSEVRASDLRFTPDESAAFLNEVMDLGLSAADVDALDTTTEGWIAGLQLAAVSLQGHEDAARFIRSFSGSHRFVLDYLVGEVLARQSPAVVAFLLHTSILDRLSGPLCDAVTLDPTAPGQRTLEHLERANLFVTPLDDERRWYRYHHLFGTLLRQRLGQSEPDAVVTELHGRASRWYDEHGFDLDAFRHAAAGHDIDHAERLIKDRLPSLQVRDALAPSSAGCRRWPGRPWTPGRTSGSSMRARCSETGRRRGSRRCSTPPRRRSNGSRRTMRIATCWAGSPPIGRCWRSARTGRTS